MITLQREKLVFGGERNSHRHMVDSFLSNLCRFSERQHKDDLLPPFSFEGSESSVVRSITNPSSSLVPKMLSELGVTLSSEIQRDLARCVVGKSNIAFRGEISVAAAETLARQQLLDASAREIVSLGLQTNDEFRVRNCIKALSRGGDLDSLFLLADLLISGREECSIIMPLQSMLARHECTEVMNRLVHYLDCKLSVESAHLLMPVFAASKIPVVSEYLTLLIESNFPKKQELGYEGVAVFARTLATCTRTHEVEEKLQALAEAQELTLGRRALAVTALGASEELESKALFQRLMSPQTPHIIATQAFLANRISFATRDAAIQYAIHGY